LFSVSSGFAARLGRTLGGKQRGARSGAAHFVDQLASFSFGSIIGAVTMRYVVTSIECLPPGAL
jgi:hypothetical protein